LYNFFLSFLWSHLFGRLVFWENEIPVAYKLLREWCYFFSLLLLFGWRKGKQGSTKKKKGMHMGAILDSVFWKGGRLVDEQK